MHNAPVLQSSVRLGRAKHLSGGKLLGILLAIHPAAQAVGLSGVLKVQRKGTALRHRGVDLHHSTDTTYRHRECEWNCDWGCEIWRERELRRGKCFQRLTTTIADLGLKGIAECIWAIEIPAT